MRIEDKVARSVSLLERLEAQVGHHDDFELCRGWLRYEPDEPCRVTNVGLVKAGKSTLFNALTQTPELFATSRARCTVREQFHAFGDLALIDTPGLDATGRDDDEAWRLIFQADALLVVHNLQTGEYDRIERDFLHDLGNRLGSREEREHVVAVFTHREGMSNEDVERTVGRCLEIWEEAIGSPPTAQFCVRSRTYLGALEKGSSSAMARCGIEQLLEHVRELARWAARTKADRADASVSQALARLEQIALEHRRELARREESAAEIKRAIEFTDVAYAEFKDAIAKDRRWLDKKLAKL